MSAGKLVAVVSNNSTASHFKVDEFLSYHTRSCKSPIYECHNNRGILWIFEWQL